MFYTPEGFMELEVAAHAERMSPRQNTKRARVHDSKPREFTPVPEQVEILPDGPTREKPEPEPDPSPQPNPSPRPISKRTGRRVTCVGVCPTQRPDRSNGRPCNSRHRQRNASAIS